MAKYKDFCLPELEREALALILVDEKAFFQLNLSEDDFVEPVHRKVFKGMKKLLDESQEVNIPSISAKLMQEGVKASEVIHSISTASQSLKTSEAIAKTLKQAAVIRKILRKAEQVKKPDDVYQLLQVAEDSATKLVTKGALSGAELKMRYVELNTKKKELKAEGKSLGLITGFGSIDEKITFKPGDLITLAARTSVGKSALAMNLAIGVAMFEQRVLFFSAEMSWDSLFDRLIGVLGGGNVTDIEYGDDPGAYQRGLQEYEHMKPYFWIYQEGRISVKDIIAVSKREAEKAPISLIVIDYLQYLADITDAQKSRAQIVGQATQRLKQLAGELNCTILLLSQVNRDASNNAEGMPELHNLRDSGSIEQDSDVVLMLNREARDSRIADLKVAKARRREAETYITLLYDPPTTKFTDRATTKATDVAKALFHNM